MTTVKKYTAPDGRVFGYLPRHYGNQFNITEGNFARLGWTVQEVEVHGRDDSGFDAKVLAFASQLKEYADSLSIDLKSLSPEQVTIHGLKKLASDAGATETKIQKWETELVVLAFDAMAVGGGTWSRTWEAIKAAVMAAC